MNDEIRENEATTPPTDTGDNPTTIENDEQITETHKEDAGGLDSVINDAVGGIDADAARAFVFGEGEQKRGRGRPSNASKGLPPPKKKSGSKSGKSAAQSGNSEPPIPDANAIRCKVEAAMLVSINDAVLNALAGEPLDAAPELREAYVAGLAGMLEEMGQPLPPWVQVAAIAAAYNARVLAKPTAKSRLIAGWLKIKSFFKRG